jgi:hypothetical protein
VRLNHFGFREREFPAARPESGYRIAFIGDSYTFGQGIAEAERMSNLLEAGLRPSIPGVEVLNFGNAGNNTSDEVAVLRVVLRDVHPDFVLLQWFVNDVENNRELHEATPNDSTPPLETAEPLVKRIRRTLRNRSVLYFLAGEVAHRLEGAVGPTYVDELQRRVGDPHSPEWRAQAEALRTFLRLCRDHRVGVGVLLVPSTIPLAGADYPYRYLHERVLEICRDEGGACTDLLEPFMPYLMDRSRYMSLWVNRFDPHMSAAANRIAADRLLAAFGPALHAEAGRDAETH